MARRKKKSRSSLAHKICTFFAFMILASCVASVTYGFFLRHSRKGSIEDRFRIEVLNGTHKTGLARRAARALRRRGIDVFKIGNAGDEYAESIIVGRSRGANVRLLAKLINCRNTIEQIQEDSMVDATLILGKDYDRLNLGWRK